MEPNTSATAAFVIICIYTLLDVSLAQPRIKGGNDTNSSVPFFVSLESVFVKNNKKFPGYCGGSILNNKTIVTAAHCLKDSKGSRVIVGLFDKTVKDFKIFCANTFIPHPEYGKSVNKHLFDIAVVKLEKELTFGSRVGPVAIPSEKTMILDGMEAEIYGVGRTKFVGVWPFRKPYYPNKVQVASVKINEQSYCARHSLHFNSSMMGCAGSSAVGARSGDSGGPVVIDQNGTPVLVGVMSYTPRFPYPWRPTYFMRITYFLEFLQQFL